MAACGDDASGRDFSQGVPSGGGGHGPDCDHCVERGEELSLFRVINTEGVVCYNEETSGSATRVFKPYVERQRETRVLVSDADEQLLIHIPFTVTVKLKSFTIAGASADSAPSMVRLWCNRDDIDFDNVEDLEPVQSFELNYDPEAVLDYPVRVAKFSGISSLTMFIENNLGEVDQTVIDYIGLQGESSEIKVHRTAIRTKYEAAPQMKDHKTRAGVGGEVGRLGF